MKRLVIRSYSEYTPFDGIVPSDLTHITYSEQGCTSTDKNELRTAFCLNSPTPHLQSMKISACRMPANLDRHLALKHLELDIKFDCEYTEITSWSFLPRNLTSLSFNARYAAVASFVDMPPGLKDLHMETLNLIGTQLPPSVESFYLDGEWVPEAPSNTIDLSNLSQLRSLHVGILRGVLFRMPPSLRVFSLNFFYRDNEMYTDTVIDLTGPVTTFIYKSLYYTLRSNRPLCSKTIHEKYMPTVNTNEFAVGKYVMIDENHFQHNKYVFIP